MDLPKDVVEKFKVEHSVPMHTPATEESDDSPAVETGVPLAPKARKKAKKHPRKGVSKYPFAQMRPPRENGDMDSFFVKGLPGRTDLQNKMKIASAIHVWRKSHPKFAGEFKYRVVDGGVRVWRTK